MRPYVAKPTGVVVPKSNMDAGLMALTSKPRPILPMDVANGAAFALVGGNSQVHAIPSRYVCTRSVARASGAVRVGVNSERPSVNKGSLKFSLKLRAPSVDQWMKPLETACA